MLRVLIFLLFSGLLSLPALAQEFCSNCACSYSCPTGQVVQKIENGQVTCVAPAAQSGLSGQNCTWTATGTYCGGPANCPPGQYVAGARVINDVCGSSHDDGIQLYCCSP